MSNLYLINYGNLRGPVLYHGTVSCDGRVFRATWTYEKNGQKVTEDGAMNEARFRTLWEGFSKPFLTSRRLTDQDAEMDPTKFHIIGLVFRTPGREGVETYRVPTTEADAGFVEWLLALGVPQ